MELQDKKIDNTAQEKLNHWQTYQEYQNATERVLRTLNFTEALAIIFLFVYAPVATYGFIPMSGILWVVLLFGGTRFSKEVEEHFPDDTMMREYTKDADARSTNPFRWGEFMKSSNGRLFGFGIVQAVAIGVLLYLR